MKNGMTLGNLLSLIGSFSKEERALVRKYGTEEYLESEMWAEVDGYYDDFVDYMSYPWTDSKVRDRSYSKAVSDISYMEGLPSKRAGSATSHFKRQARRSERRVGKELIREQVWS